MLERVGDEFLLDELKLLFDLDGVVNDLVGFDLGTVYSLLDRGRFALGEVYLLGELALLFPLKLSVAGLEYFFDLEYTSPRLLLEVGLEYLSDDAPEYFS